MRDFSSGNAVKQILLFSIPMLIGSIFQQLYSMVDAMVVGRYVGGNALAAVGVAMNVLQFLLAVVIGLTSGASVIISQLYGAGQYDKVRRMTSTSIIFLTGLTLLIAIPGIVFAPALFKALNAPPEILDEAVLYMRVLIGGVLFPIFYNMYTAYLRALGDSRSPLFILICCTVLNVGLDLLFVVAFKLGVAGAAIATIIAQSVSAGLCYLYVRRSVAYLHVRKLEFDVGLFRSILKYGVPTAVQLSFVSLAQLTITRLINSFGAAAIAGITASSKIDSMATMPVSTVSMAMSTFVAQNMGAGQEERARKGFRSALLIMLSLAICTSALIIAFGPWLISMFLNPNDLNSDTILRIGINYMNIMVVFYFLFAFLFAFNGFFRGAGDAVIAMAFPVASLTLRTVSAYLLVHLAGFGPEALAWSIPVGWVTCSFASWIYYRKRLWAGKAITAQEPRDAQETQEAQEPRDAQEAPVTLETQEAQEETATQAEKEAPEETAAQAAQDEPVTLETQAAQDEPAAQESHAAHESLESLTVQESHVIQDP